MKKTHALFRKLKSKKPKGENIEIKSGGGLGNRLINLIGGLEKAELGNLEPIISWVPTHACRARFSDLFDTSLTIKEEILKLPIKYSNKSKIPEDFDITRTVNHLLKLKPKREIIDKVSGFVDRHNIDSNVIGLHIRKTDFFEDTDVNFWIDAIMSNPSKRYFVCSDSKEEENKFRVFPNVIVLPKTEYVKKRWKDYPWIIDNYDDNRYYQGQQFNVLRSSKSVKEALCDLLILSHTDIKDTNKYSTFLHLAKYYQTILDKVMN